MFSFDWLTHVFAFGDLFVDWESGEWRMFLRLVIWLWIEKAVTDACFCFWWFVCGLRKQPADKFRVAAAARLKLFNQSSRGPDLIFKTQSGSDRKKMFDWFKPNQAEPNPTETWSNSLKPDHLKSQPIELTQTNMILSGFAIRATFYELEMQIKGNVWLIEIRSYEPMEIILADTKSLIYLSKLLAILRNLAETFVLVQTFPIWINVL